MIGRYAATIESYADMVEARRADTDLDADTRTRVADMLRHVAYAVRAGTVPSADAAVQHAYMLALTLRHPDYRAFRRCALILRNV